MTSDSKQEGYVQEGKSDRRPSKALGLGLISAVSALAGGIAVAWWYRKTLTKLQNPIVSRDIRESEGLEFGEENSSLAESDPHLPVISGETRD